MVTADAKVMAKWLSDPKNLFSPSFVGSPDYWRAYREQCRKGWNRFKKFEKTAWSMEQTIGPNGEPVYTGRWNGGMVGWRNPDTSSTPASVLAPIGPVYYLEWSPEYVRHNKRLISVNGQIVKLPRDLTDREEVLHRIFRELHPKPVAPILPPASLEAVPAKSTPESSVRMLYREYSNMMVHNRITPVPFETWLERYLLHNARKQTAPPSPALASVR